MKREGSFRMRREGSQSKIKQSNIHKEVGFFTWPRQILVLETMFLNCSIFRLLEILVICFEKEFSIQWWSDLNWTSQKNPSSVTIRREATFHILQCHESQGKNYTIDCFKKSLFLDISVIDLFAFWKYLNFSQLETRGKSSRLWAFGEKNCRSRQMSCFLSFTVNK